MPKDKAAREKRWIHSKEELEPNLPAIFPCPKCEKNSLQVKIDYYHKKTIVSCPCCGSAILPYKTVYKEIDYCSQFSDLIRRRLIKKDESNAKPESIQKVGETDSFTVEYDANQRLILVFGKETPSEFSFKLGFNEKEISAILDLLTKASKYFSYVVT
ncbi:hypothetical protein KY312_02380 [Candidatus Woesearchaeota archaeon]|nr:hypothetical protein [Candidatus Woesearchaeota archaeon]